MCNLRFFSVVILLILSSLITNETNAAFSGHWCWDKDSDVSVFSIRININKDIYKGSYSSVAYSGDKIDENDNAFSFKKTTSSIVKTKIKAGITGNIGFMELKLLDANKLLWRLLKEPEGDIYVPKEAVMHRCKG